MKQNQFYLIKQASEMSKITLLVIVYAPFLNKTTIKSNKKQMISSADTFFWMTRYQQQKQKQQHQQQLRQHPQPTLVLDR